MYRIKYSDPITHTVCSRTFKNLRTGYSFIRDFTSSLCFEVITLGTGESYYVYYDLIDDIFISNSYPDLQVKKKLQEV